jgi:hypothetical protein
MEKWLPAKGFENTHEVSTLGRIRGYKRKIIITPHPDQRGYLRYSINHTTVKIHRLIAQTFIPNPENLPEVNHINGDKQDNRVENLEWVTKSENMKHAYEMGVWKDNKSPVWEQRKKKIACYSKTGEFINEFESIQEAARKTNSSAPNIHHALNGKIKTHNSFIWKYI